MKEQNEKQQLSKSPLFGYRKPITDDAGVKWCNCSVPTLVANRLEDEKEIAYCLRCSNYYYH